MALIGINPEGRYENDDAVEHIVSYVLNPIKTPSNIHCILGAPEVHTDSQLTLLLIEKSFDSVKHYYNKPDGRKIYHFWLTFSKKESSDLSLEDKKYIMQLICTNIYLQGFQVFAALHELDKFGRTDIHHIHFAFNSVNFNTGSKYRDDLLMEMIYFFQNILCLNFPEIQNGYRNNERFI